MSLAPFTPVEGLRPPDQGPQNNDRPTRPKLKLWDRSKFILLFVAVWFLLVWAEVASWSGFLPFEEAMRRELTSGMWVLVLLGVEVVRQLHYLISEHSAGYHKFWTRTFFGGSERFMHRRFSPWTRFRLARVLKWTIVLGLFIYVLGAFMNMSPALAIFQLPAMIWSALPTILQFVFIIAIGILQFVAIFWFMSKGGVETYFPDDIKTRFADVWGQDHVLSRVKENIVFLENPEAIEAKGGYVPSGILLWGPPGTGKTLMAEAVAGETGKPYVFVDPGAFQNMFFGVGILKVKSLFRKLRKLALRYGGVIVFFDEADSLGNRGSLATPGSFRATPAAAFQTTGCHGFSYMSDSSQFMVTRHGMRAGGLDSPGINRVIPAGAGMNGMNMGNMGTLQALLTELSGLKKPRGFINRVVRRTLGMRPKPPPKYRILVMMATNMPDSLDEALLRPGRIDRIYKVGYPNKAGRVRTYKGYFDKVRHELTDEDIEKLATITPYATGATIKDIVNEALIQAIRDDREVISWKDVIKSKQLKELGPPEDNEYIERERHAVAVHEACHAVIAYRTRKHLEIDLATIEKGGDYLGMVKSIKPEDQFAHWRSEYESDIHVALASLAGERLFFDGDSTSGVSGDLETATIVASQMEAYFGMGSTISSLGAARALETGAPGARPPGGSEAENRARVMLADRIEDNLAALLEKTAQMLRDNRREVLILAHALESHKTMTGEDVTAVLEGRPGPTIDGTPYGDDEFVRQIDEFHTAAVVAHQNHSSIAIPLPVPAQTGPVAQWQPAAPPAVTVGESPRMWSSIYGTAIGGSAPVGNGNGQSGNGQPSGNGVTPPQPAPAPPASAPPAPPSSPGPNPWARPADPTRPNGRSSEGQEADPNS